MTDQIQTVANDRATTPGDSTSDHGFFGQPRVLANLFGVEMWERFSFYGMQGIVLLYLYYSVSQGGLGMDEGTASAVIGAYGGLVYLSTIPGAWLADRVLGSERTLFYSACLIMLGHIALSGPSRAAAPGAACWRCRGARPPSRPAPTRRRPAAPS
ncbi:hypothetical protein GCM10027600_35080 [Nocardioides ginsengisegetis]